MKYLFVAYFIFPFSLFAKNSDIRKVIKQALADTSNKKASVGRKIPDRQTAISIAEPILFKTYGKDQILGEKPYNVELLDGYWVITGSLPEGYLGGTFFMILSKDGIVIKLTHYK